MDLIELDRYCRQYAQADYDAGNYDKVVTALLQTVPVPQTKAVVIGDVGTTLGFSAQAIVTLTLSDIDDGTIVPVDVPEIGLSGPHVRALVSDARTRLLADTGLRLDSPQRQALLDVVGSLGNWEAQSPGLTAAIKEMGIKNEPRWQYHGLVKAPTAQDCSDAKAAKAQRDQDEADSLSRDAIRRDLETARVAAFDAVTADPQNATVVQMVNAFQAKLIELRS